VQVAWQAVADLAFGRQVLVLFKVFDEHHGGDKDESGHQI
jgi:hypothetical protein